MSARPADLSPARIRSTRKVSTGFRRAHESEALRDHPPPPPPSYRRANVTREVLVRVVYLLTVCVRRLVRAGQLRGAETARADRRPRGPDCRDGCDWSTEPPFVFRVGGAGRQSNDVIGTRTFRCV